MTISYSMAGAVEATGISRSSLLRAINSGHLQAKRTGPLVDGKPTGPYLVKADDLEAYIDGMEAA